MSKLFKSEEAKNRAQITSERVYFGALALILGVIVFFNVVSALGTLPGFCGLCHDTHHKEWKSSSHPSFSCNTCHGGPGAFGFLSSRVQLVRMVPAYLTGLYRAPVTTTVANDTCLACHTYVVQTTVQNEKLRVSHKEIVEANYECGDCHSTVVHGKAAVRQNFAELRKCLTCHNSTRASGKCDICHVKNGDFQDLARLDGSWQISHGTNWRKTHGMGDISTCQTCHSKLYCTRCHNIELPHPGAWLTTHGGEVKGSVAAASCNQCHKGALCQSCHKMDIPHPKSFLSEHSKIVAKDGTAACYSCHLKEACTRCHKYHAHRGIPQDKLKLLRKEAGLD